MSIETEKLLSDWAQALRRLDQTEWKYSGWNMGTWAVHKLPESEDLTCGTACCAYGLGTMLPSWRDAGLVLETEVRASDNPRSRPARWTIPSRIWEKLGLSGKEFFYIVDPSYYKNPCEISPLDVAQRIETYL